MPKVSIREIDNTGSERLEYLDYTVLVPGLELTTLAEQKSISGLYTKADDFKNAVAKCIPGGISADDNLNDKAYTDRAVIMTYEYLKKGLSVYYAGCYKYENIVTAKRGFVAKQVLTVDNLNDFFSQFADKGKYDLRFITIGGLHDIYCARASAAAMRCAGDRGDAVAILSTPKIGFKEAEESGANPKGFELNSSKVIDKWVNENLGEVANSNITRVGTSWSESRETYGRYAAIFAPVVTYRLVKMNKDTGEDVKLPAAFMYLTNFAKYINNYASWYAMSGAIRGVSSYAPVYPEVAFGDKDVDLLQVRSGERDGVAQNHVATNTVCEIRPYGNIIWGNRTMHPLSTPEKAEDAEAALQLVASSFLNIRHLCCAIKKQLYRSARAYSFEPNSDILWINFKKSIEPLLNEMKANQGIRGYQILKVKTNKKALLVARIRINPIEAVEDFDLTVELTDSIGVTE